MTLVVIQRSMSDVKVTPVALMPDPHETNPLQVQGLLCDFCHTLPVDGDGRLQLFMVVSPDRSEPLFLGPKCRDREVQTYANGVPTGTGMRP